MANLVFSELQGPLRPVDRLALAYAALDVLLQARAQGVREIRDSNGETLVYRSDAELAAAIAAAESQISTLSRGPVRQIRFTTSKGF